MSVGLWGLNMQNFKKKSKFIADLNLPKGNFCILSFSQPLSAFPASMSRILNFPENYGLQEGSIKVLPVLPKIKNKLFRC